MLLRGQTMSDSKIPITSVDPASLPSRRPKVAAEEARGRRVNLGDLIDEYGEVYDLVQDSDKELRALLDEHAARLKVIRDEHEKKRIRNIEKLRQVGRKLYAAMAASGFDRAWHRDRIYELVPGDGEIEVVEKCPDASKVSVEIPQ